MDEITLVRSCQKSDPKAQEVLYARYADRMYRLAVRYVRSQVDAEDIIMTAFTNLFKTMLTFQYQGKGSLEAWIRKIVVNESLQWLRRRHNFNLTEALDITLEEPNLKTLGELEAGDIHKMIAQLPTGYRTVFNLFVIEGYDHLEISKLLTISEGTSRTQLFKARILLKKLLTQEGYHYGT